MRFRIKPKPKINKDALLDDKKLEFKSIDTKIDIEHQMEDNVLFEADMKVDLNYQNTNLGIKDRVKNFRFSFTKKF